jgi:glycosyltransferase involved in cell wall biosynthesis
MTISKMKTEKKSKRLENKKAVCVVIPFYNGSLYIERALKSVYSQTVPAMEVIVVDDGSAAAESTFLAELSKEFKFTLLKKENGGQGSARNMGVAHSNAEYVCFLDQDDYFLEWHIEHLLKVVKKKADERFAFAYGELWRGNELGQVIQHSTSALHSGHPKTNLFMQIAADMHILPSASIIKISAYRAVGGFDERFMGYEDDDLFIRFFAAGYTSIFTPRPLTFWTINKSSTSYSIKMSRSRWLYVQKLVSDFPDDAEASQYIFRDLIVPRFMPAIMHDYLRSVLLKDDYLNENRTRLVELREIFLSNASTRVLNRKKFALNVMCNLNPSLLRVILNLATIFPFSALVGFAGYKVLISVVKRTRSELRNKSE